MNCIPSNRPSTLLLASLISCCITVSAQADSLSFSPAGSTAGDGGTFSFNVTLNTSHPVYDFSLYLEASAASDFSVTKETVAGASPLTDNNFIGTYPVLLSTTANSPDFGYGASGTTDIPAGSYAIATLTITVGPSVPHGTFTISTTTGLSGSEYNDAEGNIYDLPQATETVSVPEAAASMPLLCLAMLLPISGRSPARDLWPKHPPAAPRRGKAYSRCPGSPCEIDPEEASSTC